MARNYNIQTRNVGLNAATYTLDIGPVVPAGMTRYVTFIQVNPLRPSNDDGSKVYLCCGAVATAASNATEASTIQKMVVSIASASTAGNKSVAVPESPNTEHPLFTIASGNYLCAHLSSVNGFSSSVQLFVQYFDE